MTPGRSHARILGRISRVYGLHASLLAATEGGKSKAASLASLQERAIRRAATCPAYSLDALRAKLAFAADWLPEIEAAGELARMLDTMMGDYRRIRYPDAGEPAVIADLDVMLDAAERMTGIVAD